MNKKQMLTGTIKRHPDGFGFFIPEDREHPDVYIPRHSMTGIMTSDKVLITVEKERGNDRYRGEIVRVVQRSSKHIVGQFFPLDNGGGLIKDEGQAWGLDLKIKAEDTKGAKKGQLVAAEIIKYPDDGKEFTGRVTEVIGSSAEPLNDIPRVLYAQQIHHKFSEAMLSEVAGLKTNPEEKDFVGRKDLRDLDLITIDGATAKDFDDAVCVQTNQQGFRLWVAIADVSHYVKPGTLLDKEAFERGTSVYFPNFVVPMLPEILSNELCSLKPNVPRLCLVAEMQFDFKGDKVASHFYEAVMKSKARVTYGEAQEIVDGQEIEKFNHVKDNILRCADLAKLLMAKRFREGSLDLEIPETQLEIDASGVPIDVIRSERLFAHRLIEELMLAANVAVAEFLTSQEIPAMYRIHESPNEQALSILEKYMQSFGGRTSLETGKLQKRLTKALHEFEGKPESIVLNILTLRSMSQAKYSMNNLGHFGLGFENYTHFTSPIRRYPDLIVHRLLKSRVMPNSSYRLMSEEDLQTAGTWLSACEQRSVKAERQVQSIKKARFMEKFVGQEFEGMISSVARFGVFVLLREYDLDGLIRMENLAKEKMEFDEEKLRLFSERSGLSYNIGDVLKIRVESTDHDLGQINFVIAGTESRTNSSQQNSQQRSKQHRGRRDSHEKRAARDNKKYSNDKSHSAKDSDRRPQRGRDKIKKSRPGIAAAQSPKSPPAKESRSIFQREKPLGQRTTFSSERFRRDEDENKARTSSTREDRDEPTRSTGKAPKWSDMIKTSHRGATPKKRTSSGGGSGFFKKSFKSNKKKR